MALLEWSDELSVGIDLIDKQHKVLVRTINLLAMAIEKDSEQELLVAIFETLADYIITHFSYEEELLERFGYPQSEQHKNSHRALINEVTDLRSKFDAGEDHLGPEILKFLVDWLTKHIMGSDKHYAPFLLAAMKQQRQKLS